MNMTEEYSDEETARRRDATIKRMLAMPPKPHSEMKLRKSRKSKASKGVPAQSKKRRKQSENPA